MACLRRVRVILPVSCRINQLKDTSRLHVSLLFLVGVPLLHTFQLIQVSLPLL